MNDAEIPGTPMEKFGNARTTVLKAHRSTSSVEETLRAEGRAYDTHDRKPASLERKCAVHTKCQVTRIWDARDGRDLRAAPQDVRDAFKVASGQLGNKQIREPQCGTPSWALAWEQIPDHEERRVVLG